MRRFVGRVTRTGTAAFSGVEADQPRHAFRLATGKSFVLDRTDSDAGTVIGVLDSAEKSAIPISVELDDADVLKSISIPTAGRILALSTLPNGDISVEIAVSHAQHILPRASGNFDGLFAILSAAFVEGAVVLLTEDDTGRILDAERDQLPFRSFLHEMKPPSVSAEAVRSDVSEAEANILFQELKGRTCAPASPVPTCIPFLFPDDGCWGRAHEMYRVLAEKGISTGKVWNYGILNVRTVNNPSCSVRWGWHVAPTLVMNGSSGKVVIALDPSMFDGPIPTSKWKDSQNDPTSVLVETEGAVFYRARTGQLFYDPQFLETNKVLATYQLKLQLRATGASGAPPYAHCEVPVS